MSGEQKTPAPLPVVACRVFLNTDGVPSVCRREYPAKHVRALAVPELLFANEEFQAACARRFFKEKWVHGVGMQAAMIAIAAELRARAGGTR